MIKGRLKEELKKLKLLHKAVTCIKWHERKVSYGKDNPDICFYVIRRHDMHAGLFSFMTSNLGAVKTAVESGYVPVIDMMNSANSMMSAEEIGKRNAWDDFFQQPCGYNMEDVYNSRNVILGKIYPPDRYPDFSMLSNGSELRLWQSYAKKYIRILPEHLVMINDYFRNEFNGKKVLGVLCRGTDYVAMKPSGHPIQPDPETVIQKCREVMRDFDCQYLYMATEDERLWEMFRREFGELVHTYQKLHLSSDRNDYIADVANQMESPYERSREYLISIGILAKCNCLVAGAANGSYGALLMTEGYEYQYIFQLGQYQ